MADTVIVKEVVTEVIVYQSGGPQQEILQSVSPVTEVIVEAKQGLPGASGAGFVHTQGSASAEWIVNHNLGFKPAVEIFDVGGREVEADVLHMSDNQLRVYFTSAVAGTARCV